MSGKVKVVADYSSEDEEETVAHKMRSTVYNRASPRHKRNEKNNPRDKKPLERHTRNEESSSDEDVSRSYNKRSSKYKIYEGEVDRTETQLEKHSDSSDYDNRHNKRKTHKKNYQSKDDVSNHDNRDERISVQEGRHRYDSNTSSRNRKEMENRKHIQDGDGDRRKEDRSRYHWNDDDTRDVKQLEEYSDRQSDRKNYRRENRIETLKDRHDSDHERRKRKEAHKFPHQQEGINSVNRSGKKNTQSGSDSEKKESSYLQEAEYLSDSDENDYSKRDKRRKHISYERKHKQYIPKDRDWSSDSSEHSKQYNRLTKKKRYKTLDKNNERREDENSLQKSKKHRDDDYPKISEKQLPEKNRHQQNDDDDNIRTDYSKRGARESSYQLDYENHSSRKYRDEFQNDDTEKRKKKENTKPEQKSKRHENNENRGAKTKNRTRSSHDRHLWDSDDANDSLQNKYQQNSNSESEREDAEKYNRSVSQYSAKGSLREDNRHQQRKHKYRDEDNSSEIQRREKLAENDAIDSEENNREIESELQNRIAEEKESSKSDKRDPNDKRKDDILTRTGGAYIPPAKLRAMQAKITDKSSINYQRIAWEALKKSINGLINKVNVSNLRIIVQELFKENLVRAKGILARSIMQAQAASPTFTHVYAALVAIINTKFPHIGELIIKRLIIQFRRSFRRNDKQVCLACTNFIAHLVNQQIAHEVLALEILTLLLESPTDDSVELAVGFLKECGARLTDATRRGIDAIFERLRTILHDGEVDKRVQYMIEVVFAVRKDKFKDHLAVIKELDLVEEEDQFTHLITLEDAVNPEDVLNVFKFDPEFEANEAKYEEIKKALLESSDSGEENSEDDNNTDDEDDEDNENESQTIIDTTETNLVSLRRTIYLTIQSSLDFEECAHKLLKLELKPGQIVELCYMILDCCAQQRTYEKFFGLLAQRFCQINKVYVEPFEEIFKTAYDTIHRFETNKLRNVARFFAHLFYTDAISWQILSHIKLNEDDTTSSSRIFVKILFQELCEYMGLLKLNERVKDPTMQEAFEGLFPRDSPRNTRFAINFFTSIGLGGLTDELREHLKNTPKATPFPLGAPLTINENDNDNPDSSSRSDKSRTEDSSNNSSSSDEPRSKKSRRPKKKKKSKTQNKHAKKKKKK